MEVKRAIPSELIRIFLPLGLLAVGFGTLAAAIVSRSGPGVRPDAGPQVPLVETVPVETHQGGMEIKTDGTVVPYREINLSAEVGGRVVFKAPECRAGSYVTKDQLLVRIDPRSYDLEVERLTKEVAQAEVDLKEIDVEAANTRSLIDLAQQQVDLAEKNMRREQQLFERKVATEASLDAVKTEELAKRNTLVTLRNQLATIQTRRSGLEQAKQLAEAKLAEAKLSQERTEIRAPINGVIYSDRVEEDSYVQPGTLLAVIEDTSAVEVKCSLEMGELQWLWESQQAASASAAAPSSPPLDYQIPHAPATVIYHLGERRYVWQGVLNRFEGIGLDEKTRTVPCRVLVPRPREVSPGSQAAAAGVAPRALIRGMFVEVRIHADPRLALLAVPERAVRPGNTVWRVRDEKLQIVAAPVVQVLDDKLLIRAEAGGLQAGDPVVVSPLAVATDGMQVRSSAPAESVAARAASGREVVE